MRRVGWWTPPRRPMHDSEADAPATATGPVRRAAASVVDGVKLRWGDAPEWTLQADGHRTTNVANVQWKQSRKVWMVRKVDVTGKRLYIGTFAKFEDAVDARRGVVDGNMGSGTLAVTDDGGTVGITKCSQCKLGSRIGTGQRQYKETGRGPSKNNPTLLRLANQWQEYLGHLNVSKNIDIK